jgi:hypothetical protein
MASERGSLGVYGGVREREFARLYAKIRAVKRREDLLPVIQELTANGRGIAQGHSERIEWCVSDNRAGWQWTASQVKPVTRVA